MFFTWWLRPFSFLHTLDASDRLDSGIAMGLFRAPASRIVSGFNAGFHHYGMSRSNKTTMQRDVLSALKTSGLSAALKAYAEWPGIPHCQTKMLLGLPCSSSKMLEPSDEDVAKAVDIVRKEFAFVGTCVSRDLIMQRTLSVAVLVSPGSMLAKGIRSDFTNEVVV